MNWREAIVAKEHQEEMQDYQYIIDKFGEEKVLSRSEWLYNQLSDYINFQGLTDKVSISKNILKHVLIDYFVDIDRLKEFSEILRANDTKIYAYLCFWLLRHKPLQINQQGDTPELAFVNEEFVSYLLRSYLFSNPDDIPIINSQKAEVDNFVNTMLYYFKYREYSAKTIEMIILAFSAGRGYQYSADYQNR